MMYTEETIDLLKAIMIVAIGIMSGFLLKYSIRKSLDKLVLKPLFNKDLSAYELATTINKIFTEIIQWSIIILCVSLGLKILEIGFLDQVINYLIKGLPKMGIFLIIFFAGILVSKIISSRIKSKDITKKDEIALITELIIISGFTLTAFEYIGIKATALFEIYRVILYVIGAIIVIFFIKPFISVKNRK